MPGWLRLPRMLPALLLVGMLVVNIALMLVSLSLEVREGRSRAIDQTAQKVQEDVQVHWIRCLNWAYGSKEKEPLPAPQEFYKRFDELNAMPGYADFAHTFRHNWGEHTGWLIVSIACGISLTLVLVDRRRVISEGRQKLTRSAAAGAGLLTLMHGIFVLVMILDV